MTKRTGQVLGMGPAFADLLQERDLRANEEAAFFQSRLLAPAVGLDGYGRSQSVAQTSTSDAADLGFRLVGPLADHVNALLAAYRARMKGTNVGGVVRTLQRGLRAGGKGGNIVFVELNYEFASGNTVGA